MNKDSFNKKSVVNAVVPEQTKGVKTLLGDPKKAIIKLALPMILAMSVQTIYNLVDAIWVSGLGADALAAVGFVFPIFFIAMALSTGLGMGAGSAISRRIGAKDKEGADNVAVHSLIITLLLAVAFTVPLFVFAENIFVLIGAGKTVGLTVDYGQIIFAGSIFIFFTSVANAILRGEGDAKRAMYAMVLGAGLNILLDPILIYVLDMGIAGAAWATVISLAITSVIMLNWLLFKRDTYVSFKFSDFKFDKSIIKDIFRVGFPASFSQLSMSITMIIMNIIIVMVNSTDGVAIYSTGWRVASMAVLPTMGVATALISVSGAAFGANSFDKVKISHTYAIKIGLAIEIVIAILTFIFAPQMAAVFTQSESAAHIAPDLIIFLRTITIFYPTISFGMLSSAVFQGMGKGVNALIVTILRTVILTPLFAVLFAFNLNLGLIGVWWGIVAANIIGPAVAFLWVKLYIKRLTNSIKKDKAVTI
ncbi:putative efflux protein, MATE family [Thermoplasmatales archaeon SCGC AB-539-N05]|nr:putative efflux protein, MATE family [Thermoplasmatales archaeon SCGC AB-539-N05]